jgi:hypothetical protein
MILKSNDETKQKKTATVAGENTSEKVKVAAVKTYLPAKERKPRRRQITHTSGLTRWRRIGSL